MVEFAYNPGNSEGSGRMVPESAAYLVGLRSPRDSNCGPV